MTDPIALIAERGLTANLHPRNVVEPVDLNDFPHLSEETGACLCGCNRCTSDDLLCICGDCCDADSYEHLHKSTPRRSAAVLSAKEDDQ